MVKQQKIEWNEREIEQIEKLMQTRSDEIKSWDIRVALISFLIFINTLQTNKMKDYKALTLKVD